MKAVAVKAGFIPTRTALDQIPVEVLLAPGTIGKSSNFGA